MHGAWQKAQDALLGAREAAHGALARRRARRESEAMCDGAAASVAAGSDDDEHAAATGSARPSSHGLRPRRSVTSAASPSPPTSAEPAPRLSRTLFGGDQGTNSEAAHLVPSPPSPRKSAGGGGASDALATHAVPRTSSLGVALLRGASRTLRRVASAVEEELEEELSGPAEELLTWLKEFVEDMLAPLKIIINFLQIVSAFAHTLDIPWPHIYYALMSRFGVINLNVVRLPAAACLNPEPSFYTVFNAYTIGVAAAVGLILTFRACAPLAQGLLVRLGGCTPADATQRAERFASACLSRGVLLLLYLSYPAVSQAVVSMFSCDAIEGTSYLVADYRVQCYTRKHVRYMAVGAMWLLVYPIGVPLCFLGLLYYYRVPHLAAAKMADAQVRAAAAHAWHARVVRSRQGRTLTRRR